MEKDHNSARLVKIQAFAAYETLRNQHLREAVHSIKGELNHAATQAAAWHLNNDLSWPELAAKLQGTRRSPRRPPYFSREEIQAGVAYANEAARLAEA